MAPVPLSVSEIISKARESELYLGDSNLPNLVAYAPGKYGSILVLKSTMDDEVPTPAAITFFGEVSRSGCFVTPYGAYSPGKFEKQSIEKAKIKMQIRNITHPRFRSLLPEWKVYLSNLSDIHRLNYTGGAVPNITTPIKDQEICITHDLFEKIDYHAKDPRRPDDFPDDANADHATDGSASQGSSSEISDDDQVLNQLKSPSLASDNTDNENSNTDTQSPSPYSMEGWPVSGPWRDEMLANKDLLQLMPLLLYDGVDDDAQPLGPSEYHPRLPGSIVKVVCTFQSYKFSSHALAPHIDEICIITPPAITAASPKKRHFIDRVGQGSPSKKGKTV